MSMLMHVLTIGFAVFFATEIIRKLPLIKVWSLSGKKPWGCDQCMSFWLGGIANAALVLWAPDLSMTWTDFALDWPASAGVSLALILWTSSLEPPHPPELP
jgi:hypothetical protein